jgi:hypothetical protein
MTGGGSDWLVALQGRLMRSELETIKAQMAQPSMSGTRPSREGVAAKVAAGLPVTRAELAGYLSVSEKKIQRMEAAGTLTRCPGLGSAVRYAARDVLRLASASSRKGA